MFKFYIVFNYIVFGKFSPLFFLIDTKNLFSQNLVLLFIFFVFHCFGFKKKKKCASICSNFCFRIETLRRNEKFKQGQQKSALLEFFPWIKFIKLCSAIIFFSFPSSFFFLFYGQKHPFFYHVIVLFLKDFFFSKKFFFCLHCFVFIDSNFFFKFVFSQKSSSEFCFKAVKISF